MYVPFWLFCFIVLFCVLFVCKSVLYCTVLLPPGVNSISGNKYIISHLIIYHIVPYHTCIISYIISYHIIPYIISRFLLLCSSIYAKAFQVALSFRFPPAKRNILYISLFSFTCVLHVPRSSNFLSLDRPNNTCLFPYSRAQKSVRELLYTRFSTQRTTNISFPTASAYEPFLQKTWTCPKNTPHTTQYLIKANLGYSKYYSVLQIYFFSPPVA